MKSVFLSMSPSRIFILWPTILVHAMIGCYTGSSVSAQGYLASLDDIHLYDYTRVSTNPAMVRLNRLGYTNWNYKDLPVSFWEKPMAQANPYITLPNLYGAYSLYQVEGPYLLLRKMVIPSDIVKNGYLTLDIMEDAIAIDATFDIGYHKSFSYHGVSTVALDEVDNRQNLFPVFTDSIRISVTFDVELKVVNENELTIPNYTQNTLCVHTKPITQLDIKVKYKPTISKKPNWWTLNYEQSRLPNSLMYFASKNPKNQFDYYVKGHNMPIFSYATYDQDLLEAIIYNQGQYNLARSMTIGSDESILYPSPDYANSVLRIINGPVGHYRIEFYNVFNKMILKRDLRPDPRKIYTLDLSSLKMGAYKYRITDKLGRRYNWQYFVKNEE